MLQTSHVSLLQKLLDKGVDIGAGVITNVAAGALLGFGGYMFWKLRLRNELSEQHRIEDERDREARHKEAAEWHDTLCAERDGFIEAVVEAGSTGSMIALGEIWDRYLNWLKLKELDHLPNNIKVIGGHSDWARNLRLALNVQSDRLQTSVQIVDLIKQTQLPKRNGKTTISH